jgi:hypothetical protein
VLAISTTTVYPYTIKEFDTYFLEADAITGPWRYVTYMAKFGPQAYFVNHPSKFLARRANTAAGTFDAFLMYSANFDLNYMRGPCFGDPDPPNSEYHMNLQQARFRLSGDFAARLERRYQRAAARNRTAAAPAAALAA